MSGGRFLVSLREVVNSEQIILLTSLLKENVDFGAEDISGEPINNMEDIIQHLPGMESEIQVSTLSQEGEEVPVSGNIYRNLFTFL